MRPDPMELLTDALEAEANKLVDRLALEVRRARAKIAERDGKLPRDGDLGPIIVMDFLGRYDPPQLATMAAFGLLRLAALEDTMAEVGSRLDRINATAERMLADAKTRHGVRSGQTNGGGPSGEADRPGDVGSA